MYADLFRLNRFFDIIQQLERLTKITNETFTVILYSFETIYIYWLNNSIRMDVASFKSGYRLKRLQDTSNFMRKQTFQLLLALKKTADEVGHTKAINLQVTLRTISTNTTLENMTQKLDQAEEDLLELAQNVIELMTVSSEK
jgi:hypothetical protein